MPAAWTIHSCAAVFLPSKLHCVLPAASVNFCVQLAVLKSLLLSGVVDTVLLLSAIAYAYTTKGLLTGYW